MARLDPATTERSCLRGPEVAATPFGTCRRSDKQPPGVLPRFTTWLVAFDRRRRGCWGAMQQLWLNFNKSPKTLTGLLLLTIIHNCLVMK